MIKEIKESAIDGAKLQNIRPADLTDILHILAKKKVDISELPDYMYEINAANKLGIPFNTIARLLGDMQSADELAKIIWEICQRDPQLKQNYYNMYGESVNKSSVKAIEESIRDIAKQKYISEDTIEETFGRWTIEQAQAEVDDVIAKFGRIGGGLYDELDHHGFYVDSENKVQYKVPKNEEVITEKAKYEVDDDISDLVLVVYENDDTDVNEYYDQYEADELVIELEDMDLDNPFNDGIIGYARLTRDPNTDNMVIVETHCYYTKPEFENKVKEEAAKYTDEETEEEYEESYRVYTAENEYEYERYGHDDFLGSFETSEEAIKAGEEELSSGRVYSVEITREYYDDVTHEYETEVIYANNKGENA